MSAAPTSGQWQDNSGLIRTVDHNNITTKRIARLCGPFGDAERAANGRLITAAKALFELAEDALPILDVLIEDRETSIGEECEISRDLRSRIIAVIAEVKGNDQ